MTTRPSPFVSFSEAEWRQFLIRERRRPNVLIMCASDQIESVVALLMGLCVRPVHTRQLPCELSLPRDLTGTLLLWNVAQLSRGQQIEMHDWITHRPEDTQLISITSVPLLPLVEDGQFLEGLFYRINVLSLVVMVGDDRVHAQADTLLQAQQVGGGMRRH